MRRRWRRGGREGHTLAADSAQSYNMSGRVFQNKVLLGTRYINGGFRKLKIGRIPSNQDTNGPEESALMMRLYLKG